MQIEHFHVDGFGQFTDFDLDGLRPGLVVVHGPNEAGKSTLRQFVSWMLFGPRRGDAQRWTGPLGRLGGELRVRLEGDQVARLVRVGRDTELRRPHGDLRGDNAVIPLIGGMDRALFDAIFTFDLFDLQRIEALREEHVQNLLAVGATLGSGAHPADIVRALDLAADVYWRPRAPNVRIREARDEVRRLSLAVTEARERAGRYGTIVVEVADAAAELGALRDRLAQVGAERQEIARLRDNLPLWERRAQLARELDECSAGRSRLPVETRRRLTGARAAAREALETARLAEEDAAAAAAARDDVVVDDELLARAAVIETLSGRLQHVAEQAHESNELRQSAMAQRLRAERALEELGAGWDETRLAAVRVDAPVEAEAKRHLSETVALAAQVPGELLAAEAEAARVRGELGALEASLATVAADAAEGHIADIDAVLSEASVRLMDVAALGEARSRLAELEAHEGETTSEAVAGWPQLNAGDFEEVQRSAAEWSAARAEHAVAVRASADAVDQARTALAEGEAALASAQSLPGEGAPSGASIAGFEAQWSVVRDELTRARHLEGERVRLEAKAAGLPSRVGGEVAVAALEALDCSEDARGRVRRAHDAAARAAQAQEEARAAVAAVPAGELVAFEAETLDADSERSFGPVSYAAQPPDRSSWDPNQNGAKRALIEVSKDAAVQRKERLIAARGALDDLQRVRDGAPAPAAGARSTWLAVAMLVVVAAVAGAFIQLIIAAVAVGCAAVLVFVALRQRRTARSAPAPDATEAAARFARAVRDAGFATPVARGEIEVALDGAREEIARCEREEQRRDAAAAEAKLAELSQARLHVAVRQSEARRGELAAALRSLGLPVAADRALTDAWFEAAAELRAVREQLREIGREQAELRRRADALRAGLAALGGGPVASDGQVPVVLATLRGARDAAERRDAAIHVGDARVAEARRVLGQAEERAAREGGREPVPEALRAAWAAWVKVRELPPGEPDAAYVARARAALEAASFRQVLEGSRAHLAELTGRVEPFAKRARELGKTAGLVAAGTGEAIAGSGVAHGELGGVIAGLRSLAQAVRERRGRRRELEVALVKVRDELERAEAAHARARSRAADLATREEAFTRWCAAVSAPAGLLPAGAFDWLQRVRQVRALVAERDTVVAAAATRDAAVGSFIAEVQALAAGLRATAPSGGFDLASLWLRARQELLSAARLAAAQRQEREERVATADETRQSRGATARRLDQQWRTAAAEVGCADDVSWEARLAVEERLDEVAAELRTIEAELRGALGAGWDDEARWLPWEQGGVAALAQRFAVLTEELGGLGAEQTRLGERRGELQAQAAALETAADVMELSTALEAAQVAEAAARREWCRLRIARHLLQETFERFRRERQPAVLRQASAWFHSASAGAYEGLEVDEESSGLRITVRGRNGAVHPAEELSTGTTGILYMCLRLALAVDQARHTAAVPLLLDDVLAHFDPERAAAAARLLAAVAAAAPELQLVLFTCRPESVACVREAAPGAVVLEMARWAGADGPVARTLSRTSSSSSPPTRSAPVRAAVPSLRAPASDDVPASSLEEALVLLSARAEPLARADFMDALGLEDAEWNALRPVLENDDRVDARGERRGRRYTLA